MHREAHGLTAAKTIEVAPGVAEGFLGGREVNSAGAVLVPGGAEDNRDPGIRTVLFTDIVGSTALTQRLGDDAAIALFQVHGAIVRGALSALGGREVKHTGDGIMACFASRRAAALLGSNMPWPDTNKKTQRPLSGFGSVRRSGEPVENHQDLFGATVQLAARLCSHARPQSLVSNVVAELCIGKGLTFEDLGEISLKDFDRPIRVHAIQQAGG